jgi:hypothetical protein
MSTRTSNNQSGNRKARFYRLTPKADEARRAARMKFGNVLLVREHSLYRCTHQTGEVLNVDTIKKMNHANAYQRAQWVQYQLFNVLLCS